MPSRNEPTDVAVLLRTEHAVARVLASAPGEDEAHPRLLAAIGEALAWDFGALWTPTDARGSALRCAHTWESGAAVAAFAETSRSVTLATGQGLPGEVWQTGRPAWIADAAEHPRPLPRSRAADGAGLRSAFAFPVRGAGEVLAVMEFFAAARAAPDEELLATVTSLGSQIGQFVGRCRAEQGVRESDARKTAILNAAFDCIVTMDGDGNIVEANAATETTFGYRAEEMVGRELAELMIPPGKLREDHRRGLRRYMETGASRIVGHPVELTAMRADGSTFPVELAVTRPDLPGPALFCGYLRDVTERRRAERALHGMAEEQAALRRVATAVAAEVEPERLFGLIAEEVGRALDAGIGNILRYNDDGTALVMGYGARAPGRSRSVPRSTSMAIPSPPRSGAPTARRATTASKARPARWPTSCARRGSRRPVGAPVIFGRAVGRSDHLQRRHPLPARGGVPGRRLRRPRRSGHRRTRSARKELAASRVRIVEASDAERRRLERNLHDGAQQRLVATSLAVRMAARRVTAIARSARCRRRRDELTLGLEELRELARGLRPPFSRPRLLRRSRRSPTARRCR